MAESEIYGDVGAGSMRARVVRIADLMAEKFNRGDLKITYSDRGKVRMEMDVNICEEMAEFLAKTEEWHDL